jgi:uncharacterized C2H2 Zn-finger protein
MHSCEICGDSGFSDERMLEHTQKCHVDGAINGQCPFCGLTGSSSAELLLHVNQAHLDYLTPEHELMSFIDDSKTPSGDDSDSISMSCGISPSITEIPAGIEHMSSSSTSTSAAAAASSSSSNNLSNGTVSKYRENGESKISAAKCKVTTVSNNYTGNTHTKIVVNNFSNNGSSIVNCPSVLSNGHKNYNNNNNNNHNDNMDDNNNNHNNNNNCDMASSANGGNDVENHHGEGSPLRSQLGLKLKANKPKISTLPSPLMCLMCPYTTHDPSILEEHINRSHFDPISPGVNNSSNSGQADNSISNHVDTLDSFSCPICVRCFESGNDLELHVNHEHSDILSPARVDMVDGATSATLTLTTTAATTTEEHESACPVCGISFLKMKTQEMELHIEAHFAKSPTVTAITPDLEKEARKAQEQREFEMLRAQYGMDDQGNFREQSAVQMQRAGKFNNLLNLKN